jgi:hypothetical protein
MDNRTIQNVNVVAATVSEIFALQLTLTASNISESNNVPYNRGH